MSIAKVLWVIFDICELFENRMTLTNEGWSHTRRIGDDIMKQKETVQQDDGQKLVAQFV